MEQKPPEAAPKELSYWPYCAHCKSPFSFEPHAPFAYCKCGTTEWGNPRPASYVQQPIAAVLPGDQPQFWRVGLFWSSSRPNEQVLMLAETQDIEYMENHRSFARWVYEDRGPVDASLEPIRGGIDVLAVIDGVKILEGALLFDLDGIAYEVEGRGSAFTLSLRPSDMSQVGKRWCTTGYEDGHQILFLAPVPGVLAKARSLYSNSLDDSIHCNRHPMFQELPPATQRLWKAKAATAIRLEQRMGIATNSRS